MRYQRERTYVEVHTRMRTELIDNQGTNQVITSKQNAVAGFAGTTRVSRVVLPKKLR